MPKVDGKRKLVDGKKSSAKKHENSNNEDDKVNEDMVNMMDGLVFEDPFEDEFEQEEYDEQYDDDEDNDEDDEFEDVDDTEAEAMEINKNKNDTSNNKSKTKSKDAKPKTNKTTTTSQPISSTQKDVWRPGIDKLEEDEELEYDPSAYVMYHSISTEWPCLSFDFIRDDFGNHRQRVSLIVLFVFENRFYFYPLYCIVSIVSLDHADGYRFSSGSRRPK